MRILYLLRHAKADWTDSSLSDFERPLNKRGRRSAELVGKALAERSILPGKVLCSPAVRARETMEIIAPLVGFPIEDVEFEDSLYLAPRDLIVDTVSGADDSFESVLLCAHNPGIEEAGRFFLPGLEADFPTCAFLALAFDVSSWKEIGRGPVGEHAFLTPKSLGGA